MAEITPPKPIAEQQSDVLKMTTKIVAAYVGKNNVPTAQIAEIINAVHGALKTAGGATPEPQRELLKPAISVKKSVQRDYIVCLEDGKKLKILKRHLRSAYDMTPDEYRAKWGLPADYPMVAPAYAEQRSQFAKKIGLGKATAASGGKTVTKGKKAT